MSTAENPPPIPDATTPQPPSALPSGSDDHPSQAHAAGPTVPSIDAGTAPANHPHPHPDDHTNPFASSGSDLPEYSAAPPHETTVTEPEPLRPALPERPDHTMAVDQAALTHDAPPAATPAAPATEEQVSPQVAGLRAMFPDFDVTVL